MDTDDDVHHIKPTACPICGYVLTASTGIGRSPAPAAGDFSVCVECAEILRFDSDMTLVPAVRSEIEALDTGTFYQLARVQNAVREVRREREGKGRSS